MSLHYLKIKKWRLTQCTVACQYACFQLVLLKIMCPPWSNPCFGVATQVIAGREQHLNEQTGCRREFSFSIYTKKRGSDTDKLKSVSNSVVGSQIHWGLVFGKSWVHWDSVLSKFYSVRFKTLPKCSSALFICRRVSQKALKRAMTIVMSSTGRMLSPTW